MIILNGVEYTGNSVVITNGNIIIDGKTVDTKVTGVVRIEVIGRLASLRTDASVTVNGGVNGDVDAGGSVNCGDVGGSVDAGGSVNCGRVGGSVDAGGSVRHG